ncbi:Uncharacterised protein [Serratia fonticola]|uniref:Uncharacterized protein n=1 Tax=Serratia fonticola TaxID=47917 RepID=A0A3S4YZP7_SERFO|nr:Uncharacterised protein [Serratia fonticola]
MTTRADIEKGRLIYTEHLGWIDKGHAKGMMPEHYGGSCLVSRTIPC